LPNRYVRRGPLVSGAFSVGAAYASEKKTARNVTPLRAIEEIQS
jgi:hypothetical protein